MARLRLKQSRIQAIVCRLKEIDERRGVRDLGRLQIRADLDGAIDFWRNRHLNLLCFVRADQTEAHRRRCDGSARQEQEQPLTCQTVNLVGA
jgi:hypothetical protein